MITLHDLSALRTSIAELKHEGKTVALVPTMGNLHAGHTSLIEKAKEHADRIVTSIFVNPIQFGEGEDYEKYPSTFEEDKQKLKDMGLDILFAPDLKQLYPGGTNVDTRVTVPELSNILCGAFRPGHFSGVATVVSKLFINVQPDVALFGEKDFQQLLVIKRMAHELCMPVEIIGVPIMREPDGLAMSSRNAYLTVDERAVAPRIYETLQQLAEQIRDSGEISGDIENKGINTLEQAGFKPEYLSIRCAEDLKIPKPDDKDLIILVAAWLGRARLIDNFRLTL